VVDELSDTKAASYGTGNVKREFFKVIVVVASEWCEVEPNLDGG